jgi:hypothetical protein
LGDLRFQPRLLAAMPGVYRAEATDLDGDGDLDVIGCSLMMQRPGGAVAAAEAGLPSLVAIMQTPPGAFETRLLEIGRPEHPTLAVGDYDRDGDEDLAIGVAWFAGPRASSEAVLFEIRTNLLSD